MDFNLTEQQKMIQDTAKDLSLLELSSRAVDTDNTGLFPWDALRALAEADLMGMLLPPAYGGGGADLLSYVIAVEELAKGCTNTALVFVTHLAAAHGVLVGGSEELKKELLPILAQGKRLAAWAATEANAGSNVLAVETSAKSDGNNYIVNGSKVYITSAEEAEYYVTVARTSPTPGPAGLSALLINKETAGFSTGRRFLRMGMNGTSSGELFFNDCKVDKKNLLGKEGGYMPVGMAMATIGLLGVAAIALGVSQASLDLCLKYGKERVINGQPLGNYQGVQFLVSEMSVAVDATRALLYSAAVAQQNPQPGLPIAAFKAKLFATETALQVTDKALQMHGGTGYTKELPLERYYRDVRGLTLHFTPTEPLKETLGKALMGLLPS